MFFFLFFCCFKYSVVVFVGCMFSYGMFCKKLFFVCFVFPLFDDLLLSLLGSSLWAGFCMLLLVTSFSCIVKKWLLRNSNPGNKLVFGILRGRFLLSFECFFCFFCLSFVLLVYFF